MRAAFLDFNGTLGMPVQVEHPSDYALLPNAAEAVRLLNEHGFVCPVITVQSRIAKDLYSAEQFLGRFREIPAELRAQGAVIEGPYVCPHRGRDACACKKPQTLLYERAAAELDIDINESVVIGDTSGDVLSARALGCAGVLVLTGWGAHELVEHGAGAAASHVAADVLEAARWAVEHAEPIGRSGIGVV
jgi:D-glycero-D-manno-heptose 1,7-bisphosphate phosphatase